MCIRIFALAHSAENCHAHARRRSINHILSLHNPASSAASSLEGHNNLGHVRASGAGPPNQSPPSRAVPFPSSPMSLSRSPSPQRCGGWSTPGLTDASSHGTPRRKEYGDVNGSGLNDLAWAAAKAKRSQVRNTPSFTTRNEGFFSRQKRKISATLPRFNSFGSDQKDWNAEKLGRARWGPAGDGKLSRLRTLVGNLLRKSKTLIVAMVLLALLTIIWSKSSKCCRWPLTAIL